MELLDTDASGAACVCIHAQAPIDDLQRETTTRPVSVACLCAMVTQNGLVMVSLARVESLAGMCFGGFAFFNLADQFDSFVASSSRRDDAEAAA
eukprot:4012775-Amphidinium_carterae.1